jgi:hypothetical protein
MQMLSQTIWSSKADIRVQDKLIISAAIPTISDTFNSADDVGWYGTAYLLMEFRLEKSIMRIGELKTGSAPKFSTYRLP